MSTDELVSNYTEANPNATVQDAIKYAKGALKNEAEIHEFVAEFSSRKNRREEALETVERIWGNDR